MERINFYESDWPNEKLENYAREIADFLYKNKGQLEHFNNLMLISSSWSKANYANQLQGWTAIRRRRKKIAAPDTEQLIRLVKGFFEICESNEEIRKLRGLVPEKLLEKIFNDRYVGTVCKTGYGKGVALDGRELKYECPAPFETAEDCDKNRQSVDAGMWDGTYGEFVEVKFSPQAFQTKDINYLRFLAEELKAGSVEHAIFLVSMGDKNLIRKRLEFIHKWTEFEFILIGRDELFEMHNRQYVG